MWIRTKSDPGKVVIRETEFVRRGSLRQSDEGVETQEWKESLQSTGELGDRF